MRLLTLLRGQFLAVFMLAANTAYALPELTLFGSGVYDEGATTETVAKITRTQSGDLPTVSDVTFEVSTYTASEYNPVFTWHDTNLDDHEVLARKPFTIPAGETEGLILIETYRNDDPGDQETETFVVCIEPDSVSDNVTLKNGCLYISIQDVAEPAITSVVFKDELGAGWVNNSWSVALELTSTTAYDTSYGMATNFNQGWGGVQFESTGFDTTGSESLSFAVMATTFGSAEQIYVGLYLQNGTYVFVLLANYLDDPLLPNQWQEVHIPLADFAAENESVNTVAFESPAIGLLYIDELSFHSNTGVCQ